MKSLIEEIKALGNIILVIDEVHNLVGAGDAEGSMNALSLLCSRPIDGIGFQETKHFVSIHETFYFHTQNVSFLYMKYFVSIHETFRFYT